jgi:iron complex transport system substrate-binding protein
VRRGLVVAVLAGGLSMVGCGQDGVTAPPGAQPSAAATPAAAGAPVGGTAAAPTLPATVTDKAGKAVTVADISRIVVLNGDIAEIVFALGLGPRVVATDTSATFPAEVKALPKVGYQRTLSAEGILSQRPTVVLGDESAGPPAVLEQIQSAGTPVVALATAKTLEAPAAKVRAVAAALGVGADGERLAAKVDAEIADARRPLARVTGATPRVAFLYVRGTSTMMIGGRGSGADAMIAGAGGVDAGTEAGLVNFVPLTAEALVAANPDVLLLLRAGLESVGGVDGLLGLPGVAQTAAGQARRVLAYDDLYLVGLATRTGPALAELVKGLHPGL